MSALKRAVEVTSACEELVRKADYLLHVPRQINVFRVYIDQRTIIMNLQRAKDRLASAIAVAESCKEWPTSLDWDQM